jgi:hypothetical protein
MAEPKHPPRSTAATSRMPTMQSSPLPRELVVVAKPAAELRVGAEGVTSAAGTDVSSLASLLSSQGASLRPLFGISEDKLRETTATMAADTEEEELKLHLFYKVEADDEKLDQLAEGLRTQPVVDAAFVKPPTMFAMAVAPQISAVETLNEMLPVTLAPPVVTPDFTPRQLYVDPAPGGIDARYAWTVPGGTGTGVRIVDVEGGWNFSQEDLLQNQGGVAGGTATTDPGWVNHGTAVQGEIGADRNSFGCTGIVPDAFFRGVSIFGGLGSSGAIVQAANLLGPGDLILIELHRPGPRFNFQAPQGQRGFIAMEWWPDDYQAIRYAVNKGVIVIEAAGNGAENLDDAIYDVNPAAPNGPFPAWWQNPYRRNQLDSGAVLVGAGAPPPGTHGRNWGPDRSRLDFSNYGSAIDAQGWGREVTTCGYGDLQGGISQNQFYTDQFSGTSSASPIIVGAVASVQGVLRAHGRIPLSPARVRDLLRNTGSPQQDGPGMPRTQRIGNRPNLRQLIAVALQTGYWVGVQFTGTLQANQTQRWFTYNWPAHWHVLWTVVPTTPRPGAPEIRYNVEVERASDRFITYWITISNLTNIPVNIDGRFAVLGW